MSKRFEGYHDEHDLPVKAGDTVTIVKGTLIRTTMPVPGKKAYQAKIAGRTYKVKVDHILNGMTITEEFVRNGETAGHKQNPSVRWGGTGGYWFQVDINDIPEAQNGG
jgi:hypothetical protein